MRETVEPLRLKIDSAEMWCFLYWPFVVLARLFKMIADSTFRTACESTASEVVALCFHEEGRQVGGGGTLLAFECRCEMGDVSG